MTKVKSFIKNQSVLSYFILTFVISWGGVIILGTPYGMPTTREHFDKLYPIVLLPYLLGPVMSSILLICLVDGKSGFKKLLSGMIRWRVGAQWYAISIFTAPILVLGILFVFSLKSQAFLPAIFTTDDKLSLLLTGIAIGIIGGGLMEEPGWTGFAVTRLRKKNNIFVTGLFVGILWGVWHFLPTYWGSGDASGVLSLSLLLPPCFFYLAVLPAYRVLMVWVFFRTESLLIVILMHASLTSSTLFVFAPSLEGMPLFLFYLVLSAFLWLIVAVMKNSLTNGYKP